MISERQIFLIAETETINIDQPTDHSVIVNLNRTLYDREAMVRDFGPPTTVLSKIVGEFFEHYECVKVIRL